MHRRSSRSLPPRLFALGAVLFLAGYALLEYLTRTGGDSAPGRVLFWGGLVLLILGAAMWLMQPPARARPEADAPHEPETFDNDDEDDDTVPCPYCRRPMYEESERCPYCERYISREDAPTGLPTWVVVGVIVALMLTFLWVMMGH